MGVVDVLIVILVIRRVEIVAIIDNLNKLC